ncbi:hypothetical protein Nepgr_002603 [Nepenthes gracilis]|uniref:Uncharacterized protein n=1 Tax=Nepenthes gracilis TaxID=150966 RepID=A0AAD3P6K7_NEPGR|nr:hypothetical protein Nepgr_002603 [Nepenthes gracilis]
MKFCPKGKTWVAPHSRVPQLSPKKTLPKDFQLSAQGDAFEMSSSNKFAVLQSKEIIKVTGERVCNQDGVNFVQHISTSCEQLSSLGQIDHGSDQCEALVGPMDPVS